MKYMEALEHAGILANRIGQSVFLIGYGDDYAVISYKPKLLGGRSIQEVSPTARYDPDTPRGNSRRKGGPYLVSSRKFETGSSG